MLGSLTLLAADGPAVSGQARAALERIGISRGVCAVLGLPAPPDSGFVVDLARGSELVVYFQSPDTAEVAAVRGAAEAAGLLGTRVFACRGDWSRIHLADNLAGAVIVAPGATAQVREQEVLRALHPQGKALWGKRELVKPVPAGVDSWSHPYHGPDNNPQSTDQLARAPYLTKFLAQPLFVPMPEISVAAGGRVFRAFGHIAHKANQNAMLNQLICVNAYNGTILWQRSLPEGFMIHRNTMIATADTLYLADHRSCQRLDAATGKTRDEIVVPEGIADGPVWKWMALVDGVLITLVGGAETPVTTQPSQTRGLGHWPWGMWQGHDYKDPKTSFGFGRTFVAIDSRTKQMLWNHREEQHVDSRGVCLAAGRLFFYCPEKLLGCLDVKTGAVRWKNTDAELLAAIGPNGPAQHYITGYATTTYIKANDKYIFFAGPQRSRLVAARADDGRLLWQKEHGNFLLVLRDDGLYAAGPQTNIAGGLPETGFKLAYETGAVLAKLPMRRACTRATGTVDSVFFRASGGTVRIDTATNQAHHIAPMRPPCQDGVIIADGHLYWGPWMCGCQLSLYGHVALAPAGDFNFHPAVTDSRLERPADTRPVQPLKVRPGDWPTYQGDNERSAATAAAIPERIAAKWTYALPAGAFPTAPIAAGGLVFCGDRNGTVRAVDAVGGKLRWQAHTGGAIFFPPAVEAGRLFVGSADGRVYAFEAATGRPLWTFRAAPAERLIPVYGKLMSTWPVAGGVVVQNGIVYAAAGITHYDGTYAYALDAASGQVKWSNDTSGITSEKADHGVSLQGELYLRGSELRFIGGGVHEEGRYDLATGKCLNEPMDHAYSVFHTAFSAYFPEYGKYVSLDRPLPDGRQLCFDCSYEGSWHTPLMLLPPVAAGSKRPAKPLSRWGLQWRRGDKTAPVWQQPAACRFNGFVVGQNLLVAAGHTGDDAADTSFMAALRVENGSEVWREKLPGSVVKGGVAIDHQSRLFVSLEGGQILGYGPVE
jgi:outer membrane protein assembly factor BamB